MNDQAGPSSDEKEETAIDTKGYKDVIDEVFSGGELSTNHILSKMISDSSKTPQKLNAVEIKVPKTEKLTKLKSTQTMEDFKFVMDLPVKVNEKTKENEYQQKTMIEIREELSQALEHWKYTQKAYEHALGFEQVEYCIYQMMAAEQKYRMILLKARSLQVEWSKVKGDLI